MPTPTSSRAGGWQLCCVPGGNLHVKRVAGFSEIRNLSGFVGIDAPIAEAGTETVNCYLVRQIVIRGVMGSYPHGL